MMLMDNAQKIQELQRKLELLIEEQSNFSDRVEAIKKELDQLSHSKPQVRDVPEHQVVSYSATESVKVPTHYDISFAKRQLNEFTEGKTKGGVKYIQFRIVRNSIGYIIRIGENGKWTIQNQQDGQSWKGSYTEKGKTFSLEGDTNPPKQVYDKSIIDALVELAGLNEEAKVEPSVITSKQSSSSSARRKSEVERFIGENLISVIGVLVTLVGVVIGVKYAIDHNLINPLTRIILAYLLGAGILVTGIKLRRKYENFSAILVSGAMAIMYFVTFAAYSLYALLPQLGAFAIMVVFTIFMVVASIKYNRQVIAYIGLVGSYAVPFLLSDGSGNVFALFSYIAVLNTGILVLAFMRNWKVLYYGAFAVTYLIFGLWFITAYHGNLHFNIALGFGILYYLMFYVTFLAYKLIKKEQFEYEDIMMIIVNSAIFYGIGYITLEGNATMQNYLGLFTVAVALTHFIVSVIFFRLKLADRKLFYLSSVMVLVFITIAIPVQLDGNKVTFLWGAEAALLFWVGRTKAIQVYERLSYIAISIALVSLGNDWFTFYNYYEAPLGTTVFNIAFATSLFMMGCLGFMFYLNKQERFITQFNDEQHERLQVLNIVLPLLFIALIFIGPLLELNFYFSQLYEASKVQLDEPIRHNWWNTTEYLKDKDIPHIAAVWNINYILLFTAVLTLVGWKRWKEKLALQAVIGLNVLATFIFLVFGLYNLSLLRDSYLLHKFDVVFNYSSFMIGVRYVSIVFFAVQLFLTYKLIKSRPEIGITENRLVVPLFHVIFLWLLSSELINIIHLTQSGAEYKLGLTILWGVYSFVLIGFGIWKKHQHMRIMAMILFGIVLIKLFFYDIVSASTIAKTIVFIIIGLILLAISFLYNKYKAYINDED